MLTRVGDLHSLPNLITLTIYQSSRRRHPGVGRKTSSLLTLLPHLFDTLIPDNAEAPYQSSRYHQGVGRAWRTTQASPGCRDDLPLAHQSYYYTHLSPSENARFLSPRRHLSFLILYFTCRRFGITDLNMHYLRFKLKCITLGFHNNEHYLRFTPSRT